LFRYAPLEGQTFAQLVSEARRAALPDSLVVIGSDGGLLTRSVAVLYLLRRLGGPWRLAATVLGWIPRPIRDAAYALVASLRRRLFAAPAQTCPVVSAELLQRFDP
jgi:predicted DCC family thiol-disulfide oxidoreductase YuxK